MSSILLACLLSGSGGIAVGLSATVFALRRLRRALRAARHDAHTDPLTGLPNRRGLATALAAATSSRHRLAVLLVDLDGFKPINDRFGHNVGDQVLRTVAARLCTLPPPLALVARLGGDEFVLLARGHPRPGSRWPEQVALLAHATRHAISQPIHFPGHDITISASIGFTTLNVTDTTTADHLQQVLHRADLAMYKAKTTSSGVQAYLGPPALPQRPDRPARRRRDRRR